MQIQGAGRVSLGAATKVSTCFDSFSFWSLPNTIQDSLGTPSCQSPLPWRWCFHAHRNRQRVLAGLNTTKNVCCPPHHLLCVQGIARTLSRHLVLDSSGPLQSDSSRRSPSNLVPCPSFGVLHPLACLGLTHGVEGLPPEDIIKNVQQTVTRTREPQEVKHHTTSFTAHQARRVRALPTTSSHMRVPHFCRSGNVLTPSGHATCNNFDSSARSQSASSCGFLSTAVQPPPSWLWSIHKVDHQNLSKGFHMAWTLSRCNVVWTPTKT